jgi:hypothetical protein
MFLPSEIFKTEAHDERSRETPYWALERGVRSATKGLEIYGGKRGKEKAAFTGGG